MTAQATARPEDLALQRLYHFEKTAPDQVILTQPTGGGAVSDFTWRQVMDESRRMAGHLKGLGHPPGSRIAILSKNTAYWLMCDFAIWLAGHVSVPLYPTLAAGTIRQILEHSEAKLLFIGKLDGWEAMAPGIPAGLPCIATPLAPSTPYPRWEAIVRAAAPLAESPLRPADELSTIMYTSGTTGQPKGVMHSFGTFAWSMQAALKRVPLRPDARILSYLPLAHVAERTLVEHALLATGMHVFFAETLETFTADLQRARPTVFFSVPRLWVKFQQAVHAKMPPAKLARLLKLPVIGGMVRQDPGDARSRPVPVRGRWRSTDAARAAGLVCAPRAADHRGLRHDRELRRLPRDVARRTAAGYGRQDVRGRAVPHRS